jgi:hypothetical protein
MRKLFVSLAVLVCAVMVVTSSAGALAPSSTGSARLHPYDRSGVKARISFLDTRDDNTGLIVSGTATGLDPAKVYISLIYDNGSVPGGPQACEPTDNTIDEEQMFAGGWQVSADGTGTLFFIMSQGAYVPLGGFDTISIRCAPVLGPPETFELVACGQVSRHK